jgi:hypothetical protein
VVGGIALIVSGAFTVKSNKKVGTAMIVSGAAALLGGAGSETKIVKALIDSFHDTLDEEIVEA